VLVDPFDLNVEERFVVHGNTGSQFHQCREVSLVRELYVMPLLLRRLLARWARQELRGEIGDDARFLLAAGLRGRHALLVHTIPDQIMDFPFEI
jgi:hypothetical protein